MARIKDILVAVDFGESSRNALSLAVDLAQTLGASLTLIHAYDVPGYAYEAIAYIPADLLTPIEAAAREALDDELENVRKLIPGTTSVLRRGSPAQQILAYVVEAKPDLVVIGTHGRKGISHAVLGSVAEKVVRMSTVPVLTVRGG